MQSFLSLLAADLLQRFGKELHHITVVFPNKRAGLFLNHELSRLAGEPIWAPRYATMGDVFLSLSDVQRAESIDAVCTLYQAYCQQMGDQAETLDQFYGWGEQLVADFDDVDKHMAPARSVFANVHELQQLTDLSYLTKGQEEALRHFLQHFSKEKSTRLRNNFLLLWEQMYSLYCALNEALAARGLMYEGALFRRVAEELDGGGARREELVSRLPAQVVFAGFNVLNDVEEHLMLALKQEGRALFYWDYDTFYTQQEDNEAGLFMRRNLDLLGSALSEQHFDNLRHLSDITFVATATNYAQAQYATPWLCGALNAELWHNAIVLCDESLLLPLLHAIPSQGAPGHPQSMNATMGFPLRDTPVFALVMALAGLQTEGYDVQRREFRRSSLVAVRKHPYFGLLSAPMVERYAGATSQEMLRYLDEALAQVGSALAANPHPDLFAQLYAEAVFQAHRALQQLLQLVSRPLAPLAVEPTTLRRLLRAMLAGVSIPFHGEPATGVQVMGVLETRCLDFSHLLILSLEEGKLPKPPAESSLIPPALREAFGLTTDRHRVAVYAYYFYRLIQRTEHLTCVYNENCSLNARHEMSRFLRQLLAETSLPVRHLRAANEPLWTEPQLLQVEKTPQMIDELLSRYDTSAQKPALLSPTALNAYLYCPLRFYYRYVARLREREDPDEPELAPLLGTIFHDTAQLIYEQLMARSGSNIISKAELSTLVADARGHVGPLLDILFEVHLFHPITDNAEREQRVKQLVQGTAQVRNQYMGEQIIYYNVLLEYLTNLLRYDLKHAPFSIVGMEVTRSLDVEVEKAGKSIRVGGRVDRIDVMDGLCRIVDYKTGSAHHDSTAGIAQIFTPSAKRNGYYFQTMLYALAELLTREPQHPVVPALFYVGQAHDADTYSPLLKMGKTIVDNFADHADEYYDQLKQLLNELADTSIPFCQTECTELCARCPYHALCK